MFSLLSRLRLRCRKSTPFLSATQIN